MSMGGGGGGQNTVTQTQSIPDWAQDLVRSNVDISQALGARPYMSYGGSMTGGTPDTVSHPYTDFINSANPLDQEETQHFYDAWNQGKVPGSPGYVDDPSRQWGTLADRNKIMSAVTGYTGNYGSGGDTAWLATQPKDIQDLHAQFIDEWNSGKIPGSAGYVAPTGQDFGTSQADLNKYLAGMSGYTGNFGAVTTPGTPGHSTGANADLLVADLTQKQHEGMDMSAAAADSWRPDVTEAEQMTRDANGAWGSAAAQQYMSPFTMAALQPQLQEFDLQQAGQRKQLDAGATQAGAFGDARHGVEDSLNNFYGNLARGDIVSKGMNDAYNTGMSAFQADKARQQAGGAQMAQLGTTRQTAGIAGGKALFDAGTQQQEVNQARMNVSYQDWLNQQMWPTESLNMRIAALANSPYSQTNVHSLAPGNATAQNIGAFSALAGGLGNIFGGGNVGSGGFAGSNF